MTRYLLIMWQIFFNYILFKRFYFGDKISLNQVADFLQLHPLQKVLSFSTKKIGFSTLVAVLLLLKNLLLSSYLSPPRKSDFSTPVAGLHLFKNLLLQLHHVNLQLQQKHHVDLQLREHHLFWGKLCLVLQCCQPIPDRPWLIN